MTHLVNTYLSLLVIINVCVCVCACACVRACVCMGLCVYVCMYVYVCNGCMYVCPYYSTFQKYMYFQIQVQVLLVKSIKYLIKLRYKHF